MSRQIRVAHIKQCVFNNLQGDFQCGANPQNHPNKYEDCLCIFILWLALSQPFGLRLKLGVPQQSSCFLVMLIIYTKKFFA